MNLQQKEVLAYVIGVALGDGNLSNPNGRAVRLRITCDARYPRIADTITKSLQSLLPRNKVSIVHIPRVNTYFDISVYSNQFQQWLPWKVGGGSKMQQQAQVLDWIKENASYTRACLRGLLQTDGSIYHDRGYRMINFTNSTRPLAEDVSVMLRTLGFRPTITHTPALSGHTKYAVRIARDVDKLVENIELFKN